MDLGVCFEISILLEKAFNLHFQRILLHQSDPTRIIEGLCVLSHSVCIAQYVLSALHQCYLRWKGHKYCAPIGYPLFWQHSYGVFGRCVPRLVIICSEKLCFKIYLRAHTVQVFIWEQGVGTLQEALIVQVIPLFLLLETCQAYCTLSLRWTCLARILALIEWCKVFQNSIDQEELVFVGETCNL